MNLDDSILNEIRQTPEKCWYSRLCLESKKGKGASEMA